MCGNKFPSDSTARKLAGCQQPWLSRCWPLRRRRRTSARRSSRIGNIPWTIAPASARGGGARPRISGALETTREHLSLAPMIGGGSRGPARISKSRSPAWQAGLRTQEGLRPSHRRSSGESKSLPSVSRQVNRRFIQRSLQGQCLLLRKSAMAQTTLIQG